MNLEECWVQKSLATRMTQRSQGWRTTTPAFRVENGFCLPFLEGITLCANIPGWPSAPLWAPRSPCSLQLRQTFYLVYCFSYLLWKNRPFSSDPVCCKINIFNGQRCVKEACRSWTFFKIPLWSLAGGLTGVWFFSSLPPTFRARKWKPCIVNNSLNRTTRKRGWEVEGKLWGPTSSHHFLKLSIDTF